MRKYIGKIIASFFCLLIMTAGVLIIPTPQANALTYYLTDAYPPTRPNTWGGGAFHVSLCQPKAWGLHSYLHFSSLGITPEGHVGNIYNLAGVQGGIMQYLLTI